MAIFLQLINAIPNQGYLNSNSGKSLSERVIVLVVYRVKYLDKKDYFVGGPGGDGRFKSQKINFRASVFKRIETILLIGYKSRLHSVEMFIKFGQIQKKVE